MNPMAHQSHTTSAHCCPHLQSVANLAWAFARLDYYSYAFLRSALRAYASNPSAYRPQEVCNLLWASTRQRFHPEVSVHFCVACVCMYARLQQVMG